MKKKITRQVFFNFLRKHKCLREYLKACNMDLKHHNANRNENFSLKKYLQYKELMDENCIFNDRSIIHAFSWNTHHRHFGETSWNSINNLWNRFLQDNNLV